MSFRLPAPVLLFLLALAMATLIALGVWQLRRNEWKNDLVAARNAQLAGQPLSATDARARTPEELDYRLVALEGRWDTEHVLILANRARFGRKGENVIQPLVLPSGEAVLVDRGWYPVAERDATLARLAATPAGTTHGLARYVEGLRSSRTPAGTWTGIAPESMSRDLPYPVLPWFVVEGDLDTDEYGAMPASFPSQGFPPYTSTTPHMEYALTWFGIAAALAVIAALRFVVEPRRARLRAEQGVSGEQPPR